jgi:hypothetical protein
MYEAPERITQVIIDFLEECTLKDSGRQQPTG